MRTLLLALLLFLSNSPSSNPPVTPPTYPPDTAWCSYCGENPIEMFEDSTDLCEGCYLHLVIPRRKNNGR